MRYTICLPVVILLVRSVSSDKDCWHWINCNPPNCRCWNDPIKPGYLNPPDTPQMVALSFTYAINDDNVKGIVELFSDVLNPNACPAHGTFFIPKLHSSPASVKILYDLKHEIAVTSSDGTLPTNWTASFNEVKQFIVNDVGLTVGNVTGARAPNLMAGGDLEMLALRGNALLYDSSCVTMDHVDPDQMLWPYTYDFVGSTPKCVYGQTPSSKHPGIWELVMPEMEYNGKFCATLSACDRYLDNDNATAIFEFLNQNFLKHYNHQRTPFNFVLDTTWLDIPGHLQGTKQFLQNVRSAYKDTWIVTNNEIVSWMRNPVIKDKAPWFGPWGC